MSLLTYKTSTPTLNLVDVGQSLRVVPYRRVDRGPVLPEFNDPPVNSGIELCLALAELLMAGTGLRGETHAGADRIKVELVPN